MRKIKNLIVLLAILSILVIIGCGHSKSDLTKNVSDYLNNDFVKKEDMEKLSAVYGMNIKLKFENIILVNEKDNIYIGTAIGILTMKDKIVKSRYRLKVIWNRSEEEFLTEVTPPGNADIISVEEIKSEKELLKNKTKSHLLDKNKQTRTISNIKSIGVAIEMYRTNVGFLPNGSGTALKVFALDDALSTIAGSQIILKDGWNNDVLIISNPDADSYAIGSPGKEGVFNGWDQPGPLLSDSDYNQDIIYSNGTYVSDPKKQIVKELYTKRKSNNNLITIKGTLVSAETTCFLRYNNGDLYLRNTDKLLTEINNKNMWSKPVVISGIKKYENESDTYDVSMSTAKIIVEEPIKSFEGTLEGKFDAGESAVYFVTKNGTYYINISGSLDKKIIWEKIYKFVDSGNVFKFNGLIEEYSNGNKFININKL